LQGEIIAIKKRIRFDRKKTQEWWNCVKKKTISKTILNKINSNQKNENQIWQIKNSIGDEIENNFINYSK
jgi:hypothetical protein